MPDHNAPERIWAIVNADGHLVKTRLLVARMEGEEFPYVIAAMPMSLWEHIPPDEWDAWRRERAHDAFNSEWTAYEYIEVVMEFPAGELSKMFDAREIQPTSMRLDEETTDA